MAFAESEIVCPRSTAEGIETFDIDIAGFTLTEVGPFSTGVLNTNAIIDATPMPLRVVLTV
jgi:hypothetical protein